MSFLFTIFALLYSLFYIPTLFLSLYLNIIPSFFYALLGLFRLRKFKKSFFSKIREFEQKDRGFFETSIFIIITHLIFLILFHPTIHGIHNFDKELILINFFVAVIVPSFTT